MSNVLMRGENRKRQERGYRDKTRFTLETKNRGDVKKWSQGVERNKMSRRKTPDVGLGNMGEPMGLED
jgi:hypothetical protein